MSFRRPRLRNRRQTVALHYENQPCSVWLPDPDEPLVLEQFADAANLAFGMLDSPVCRDVLVLLDERRQITSMFLDPPTTLGLFVGWCDGPGLEVPFAQTMTICVTDHVPDQPAKEDREGYFELRRIHLLQGLQLIDVLMVDHDRVASLAIACDRDAVWFDDRCPTDAA